MAKEKDVKRSEAKRGGGGKTVAAVAIAALLLGGGGYYGLSGDGMGILPDHGFDPGSPDVITTAEPASDVTTTEASEKQDNVLSIRVAEEKVYYEGEEIAVTAFEEAILKDYRDGLAIKLEDDHAVKATYDQIKAVLDRLGYKYTEE